MYKYADKDNKTVTNVESSVIGIHPGNWMWELYEKWVADGGVTEPFDTRSPAKIAAAVKAEMWNKIKAERDDRMDGGFKVETETDLFKWFHSDRKSRIQQLGLLMAGASVPTIPWKTMDGTFTPMSQALMTKIFQAAMTLDGTLFTVAEQHKTAMVNCPDPASYDYSTGWPEVFNEI